MRPIKLVMQAFGPYADKEIIDFAELGSRTMFVISGKTGSGKTTIFDGISFAIYGRASGDDRASADLRSQFAKDDLLTEVSLEFSLKGKTYFITRAPQQEKKKTRGDGYTIVNAKAELYILNDLGEYRLLAANVRETDEKIKEIIQLDANQFRQILMIPQGEFRKLLTSDSKEKEGILQRLFHTELYKQIEEKLKDHASLLKKQVELGMTERTRLLKNISYGENDLLAAALEEESLNDLHILSLLDELLKELRLESETLINSLEKQKTKRDEAKRLVDIAEDVLKQFSMRDVLSKRKKELDTKELEINEIKTAVELAQKANKLQHQEQLCQRLKKELDGYEQHLERELSQKNAIEEDFKKFETLLTIEENKTDERDQISRELLQLKNIREDVYSYDSRLKNLNDIENKLDHCRKEILSDQDLNTQYLQQLNETENDLKQLERTRIEMFELDKKTSTVEADLQQLITLQHTLQKAEKMKNDLQILNRERENVDLILQDANDTLHMIEQQWFKGQAGHLAATMHAHTACPVCGSTEHPAPAQLAENYPTEDDMKAAKLKVEKLNDELAIVERNWIKLKTELDIIQEKISEIKGKLALTIPEFKLENTDDLVTQYERHLSKMKQSLSGFALKVQQIPTVEKQILTLKETMNKHSIQLEKLIHSEKQLAKSYVEAEAIVQNLSRLIPEELRIKRNYDDRVSKVEAEKLKMDAALDRIRKAFGQTSEQLAEIKGRIENLTSHVKSAQEALNFERTTFKNMLELENFDSYKHYHESKKNVIEINKLDVIIRMFYEELRSVSDRLADYDHMLKEKEKPDLEKLEQMFKEYEAIYTNMSESQAQLSWQINKNEEIRQAVIRLNKEIKKIEMDYEIVGHLAEITKGQNTYRLSFERYVLASFLDEILEAANIRLVKMTSGRYQLIRKTDRSKGNVQSGLELLVFDQYTGQDRHVKTLSGGESFKAALALALGLADIVQEHAGGVSLETMFIDEGFGTLDPESLDNAIEALMDIQSTGRLVGIISHVPELKERIDARLEVKAYQHGSKTEFCFLG